MMEGGKLLLATEEPLIPVFNDTTLRGMEIPSSFDVDSELEKR